MNQFEKLSTETIDGGQAVKQFDYQLREAVKNALDPNTKVDAKRTVVLKVHLVPNNSRDTLGLSYEVTTKFPCDAPGSDIVHVSPSTKEGFVPSQQMTIGELLNRERDEEIINLKTGEVEK